MEIECVHCKKVYKTSDLDETSKKQLEYYLKEIKQSIYLELAKRITNKYEEELKQYEEERKETYSYLKNLESEIESDNDPLRKELLIEKMQLEKKIARIKLVKNNYNIWLEKKEMIERKTHKNLQDMKPFFDRIKKTIVKELSYLDLSVDDPYTSFLSKISLIDMVKEMKLDKSKKYLQSKRDRKIYRPFSHLLGSSIVCFTSLEQLVEFYEKNSLLQTIIGTIILNTIYGKLQPIVKELEKKVPVIKEIGFKSNSNGPSIIGFEFEYFRNEYKSAPVYFLDALMQEIVERYLEFSDHFIYTKKQGEEIYNLERGTKEYENAPSLLEIIKLLDKKCGQLNKEKQFLQNKLEIIMKRIRELKF